MCVTCCTNTYSVHFTCHDNLYWSIGEVTDIVSSIIFSSSIDSSGITIHIYATPEHYSFTPSIANIWPLYLCSIVYHCAKSFLYSSKITASSTSCLTKSVCAFLSFGNLVLFDMFSFENIPAASY